MDAPRAAVPANNRAALFVKFDVTPLRFFIITSILQPLDSAADRHTSGDQFEYSRHWTPKSSPRFPRISDGENGTDAFLATHKTRLLSHSGRSEDHTSELQ